MSDKPSVLSVRSYRRCRDLLAAATPYRRVQLLVVLALTLLGSLAELVTIGAVLPLLALAASPDQARRLGLINRLLETLAGVVHAGPIVAASLLLALAAIGATIIRFALNWATLKFCYGLEEDLAMAIFSRALRQPYSWYLRQNSSSLIAGQEQVRSVVSSVLNPLIVCFSAALIAMVMGGFLFMLAPGAALVAALTIGGTYALISFLVRRRVQGIANGHSVTFDTRVKTLQETLGGIRDIILDRSEAVFEKRYHANEDSFRRLVIGAGMIVVAPRLLVEGVTIVLVAAMAVWFSLQPSGLIGAIPVLGALALGAQRMLPMVQQVYVGLSNFALYGGLIDNIIELLNAPLDPASQVALPTTPKPFRETLALERVTFDYGESRIALRDIDLVVRRGERVGLIGKTGSGKSTLVDLLMGLLQPTDGRMLVDGAPLTVEGLANWRAQIAHVPQQIFLADDSIAANIAFGQAASDVDRAEVLAAATRAGLGEFLERLPAGLDELVGERGVRLSGGQRQRIGIARALYKRATVLVLDEATSALDDETEASVMASVEALGRELTILMVAHRLTTLSGCDRIIRLADGRIERQGTYREMLPRARAS